LEHLSLINEFRKELISLSLEIESSSSMGHFDINKVCEDLFCGLFRELLGLTQLRNLNNEEKQNFPGIDLADDQARIAIQVTSTSTLGKIKDTISTSLKYKFNEKYDRLIVFILTKKHASYSQSAIDQITQEKFIFNVTHDVMDYSDLATKAANVSPQILNKAVNILRSYTRGSTDGLNKEKVILAKPEQSALLKEKKKQACAESRKHNIDSALRLWNDVRKQAEKEGNKAEEIAAWLQTVLVLAWDERNPNEALKLADACLQDAKTVDLGDDRPRLLQLIGEVHRIKGNKDQARGFLTSALEHARTTGSKGDEGFALLSLSALEKPRRGSSGDNDKALEFVELAYNAFSALYVAGDDEKQKTAKDGFAQCHCWRAAIFDYARSDDALAEWTRALDVFQNLGEGWEWDAADTLLRRADLRGRIGEPPLAIADIDAAAKIYHRLGNTVGLAKCHLQAGELADLMDKRTEAAEQYQQAAAIAATWKNDSRASYFYFRHACKLVELREYVDAEKLFNFLVSSEWLERELKLTVISQLCLVAQATGNNKALKERCSIALALIDELTQEATSAEELRSLLIQKGQHLEQFGQHDQALQCFEKAIERFEAIDDQTGIAECWYQIRGVMQKLGDQKREREASEKLLALVGVEKTSPMWAALTLVGLAQLNIKDQRFVEASQQLDRAEELDPKNPAVVMIAADLRRKLPQLSSQGLGDAEHVQRPPQRDLLSLIQELHEWCACYPQKQKAILPLWYYIHRTDLWGILRSMAGVKFLICAVDAAKFERIKNGLCAQGDLFVWGTNFALDTKPKPELIPVPKGFLYPAGITVVTPKRQSANTAGDTNARKNLAPNETSVLVPVSNPKDKPYYLAYLKGVDGFPDGSPFFAGKKYQLDPRIVKFMLGSLAKDMIADNCICLPLTEREAIPNLRRTMQVAWENGAIPVFSECLPHSDRISAVCDIMLQLPAGHAGADACIAAKELWGKLLSSCSESPTSSLTTFKKEIAALLPTEPKDRIPVRIYLLRFLADSQEAVHPAIVIIEPSARPQSTQK
jgi:tetratricopeptide (TPR) repeat protein